MTQPLSRGTPTVLRTLTRHERIAVCLDVDGTLAPLVRRPPAARVPGATRAVLRRLMRRPRVTLVLVSGRAAHDARRVAGIVPDWIIGNHGFELARRSAGARPFAPAAGRAAIRRAAPRIRRAIERCDGVHLEDKWWTLSVHYRAAGASARDAVWEAVRHATRGLAVQLHDGKRIVDVRPDVAWNKGEALCRLLRRVYARSWTRIGTLYAGDDVTDEHVFTRLPRAAVTIKVGPGRTAARFRTSGPAALAAWLSRLDRRLA